jgi:5-methylcytosine-specific restriction endonuclease McrA
LALSQLRFRFPPRRIFPIAACLVAGIEVQPALALTMLYLKVIRNYWVALARSYSWSWRNRNFDRPFLVESKEASHTWLRLRSRVLRRDHRRCRGCDRKEGEVILKIHQIRPGASKVEDFLTICVSCRILARNLELQGLDIPDFLRLLWRYLHRPAEPKYALMSDLEDRKLRTLKS